MFELSNAVCQVMERGYNKYFVALVKQCDERYEDAMMDSM